MNKNFVWFSDEATKGKAGKKESKKESKDKKKAEKAASGGK